MEQYGGKKTKRDKREKTHTLCVCVCVLFSQSRCRLVYQMRARDRTLASIHNSSWSAQSNNNRLPYSWPMRMMMNAGHK